jgi:hypothetical protein
MGEGPIDTVTNVANSGNTCVYKLGQAFSDFDSTCVQPLPSGNPNNTVSQNKLFGAMSHTDEAYEFDITGIDPQFAAASLAANTVISDKQVPAATDVAYDFTVDQFEVGVIANDFTNNDVTQPQDLHGLGMVTLEWANNVQNYMKNNGLNGVTGGLGNAACITAVAANTAAGKPTPGCSGIEGIITTAPPALAPASMAVNALGTITEQFAGGMDEGYTAPAALNVDTVFATGLKPGTWYSVFCGTSGDPTTGLGYGNCQGGTAGGPLGPYYFNAMQAAVQAVYGTNQVPEPLSSRRFYFQQWILAVIKYLQTADNPNATLAQIDANTVDPNQLFFDSAGGGFENGNYVFRNDVNSAMQPPTIVNVSTNLLTSVVNNFTFARYNFRGDKALYTALTTTATDQLGAEPIYLSNLVGSPVLQATYGGLYECAIDTTGTDPNCSGVPAPIDPLTGLALYAPYQGAFGATVFNIAANGDSPTASAMTVNPTDFEFLQSAMVTLPIWSNPYDPTTAMPTDQTISVLLPYVPEGSNIGFPVTIDGSRDKFYNTNEIVFTGAENLAGTNLEATVDYEYVAVSGADGGTNNILVVRAIESQAYLGLLFVCAEPNPTTVGVTDILGVKMYQYGSDILTWIADHPKSIGDCGIEIKYSIYGNYPDYISSLTNGVRFGLNPGSDGFSVVSDGTLFDPNVVATLGQ